MAYLWVQPFHSFEACYLSSSVCLHSALRMSVNRFGSFVMGIAFFYCFRFLKTVIGLQTACMLFALWTFVSEMHEKWIRIEKGSEEKR